MQYASRTANAVPKPLRFEANSLARTLVAFAKALVVPCIPWEIEPSQCSSRMQPMYRYGCRRLFVKVAYGCFRILNAIVTSFVVVLCVKGSKVRGTIEIDWACVGTHSVSARPDTSKQGAEKYWILWSDKNWKEIISNKYISYPVNCQKFHKCHKYLIFEETQWPIFNTRMNQLNGHFRNARKCILQNDAHNFLAVFGIGSHINCHSTA